MDYDRRRRKRARARLNVGRTLSRALCAVLAVVGALPLMVGILLRTELVRQRASRETEALIQRLVGVKASYSVRVELLPLQLVLENVRVDSTDGGAPALTTRRVSVTPRLFSLLAGQLDAGDIEIQAAKARIVVKDGQIMNLRYRLPESKGKAPSFERAPFASLSLTDAQVSLDIDDVRVGSGPVDIDVFAEPGLAFETALRIGESHIVRVREKRGSAEIDDDVLCELDARMRLSGDAVLIRRLDLIGSADSDPGPGSFGSCRLGTPDAGRVELRLAETRVALAKWKPSLATGHVITRVPLSIANRFAKGPFRGWAGVNADVRWDPRQDLPDVSGKARGEGIEMGVYKFAQSFDSDIEIKGGDVEIRTMHATYGHATVLVEGFTMHPLWPGSPVMFHRVDSRGLRFEDLMENNDVTKNTIVQWNLDKTLITDFGGTLDPLRLDGEVHAESTAFEIFDRAYHLPTRRHVLGVKAPATIHTRFGVTAKALTFMQSRVTFGGSELNANIAIGLDNVIKLDVGKSKIRLSDASPLVDIPMEGTAQIEANMGGLAKTAELNGELKVDDLVFDGYPIGDIDSSHVRFKPLVLDFTEVHGVTGGSRFYVPSGRLDFDSDASLLVDARVKSDRLDLRDFFNMWHFDQDPRFDHLTGRTAVDARIQYDMGGRRDKCRDGYLRVDGSLKIASADLFEEHYDGGDARFGFAWVDPQASYLGMQLDVPSLTLKKGEGTILGNLKLTDGGVVRGHFVGSGVPLSHLGAFDAVRGIDGAASAIAEVSGTLDAMVADVDAKLGPTRLGRAMLPSSQVRVHLEPISRPAKIVGKTACGRPMTGPFEQAVYDQDRSDGVFHITGQIFGGQVALSDLQVTRQRSKTLHGSVVVKGLDLGAIAELSPAVSLSERRLEGRASGTISLDELPLDHVGTSTVALQLDELRLGRAGVRIELTAPARLAASHGRIEVSGVTLAATVPTGERALFDLGGSVSGLGGTPKVDVTLALRKTELGIFSRLVPQAERVAGTLSGSLRVNGTYPRLAQSGRFNLEHGELALRGTPVTLTDVDVAVGIDSDEVRILKANASVGGGTVDVRGSAPIRGLSITEGHATITARNVALPVLEGVRSAADADLELAWQPTAGDDAKKSLPKLSGDVTLTSFRYTRKVTVAADIDTLTKRGHRTQFESYDPVDDFLDLDIRIRSARPLEINNDLVEAKLDVADPGLMLSGTNQRFGLRGELDIQKGGHMRLRRNDFEITQGLVRFDDDERIAPRVDVTAVTDYHRYDDTVSSTSTAGVAAPSAGNSNTATSATAGGRWRITLHAYGDPDTLRVDLTSEPALSQDDIFLLLTLGLTRAELDRAQSASAGGSVALEALGRLTGADEAVTDTIPVIDEFKLGSAYSSRTGRTEPTVTIGKRLAQRIRAYVTSGLSDQREVRSNLEWRLSPRVSVEGSYDNVNDISSSTLGNLGADIRWRLEFE